MKYDGKGASECADCELRGVALTNLNFFYPVAERAQAHKSRWTGFGSEQPECVVHIRLHGNPHNKKKGGKIPLLKVLEGSQETSFKKFPE